MERVVDTLRLWAVDCLRLIALVGVAGVLTFSVSAHTRLGMRLPVGSAPRQPLACVLSEGMLIAAIGIAAGASGGYALARITEKFFKMYNCPGQCHSSERQPLSSLPPSSLH